jgi:hypothetical protein
MAATGQMSSQSVHEMQSNGRGSQGSKPDMARHSVGQIATQSAQPVHRALFNTGRVAAFALILPHLHPQDR